MQTLICHVVTAFVVVCSYSWLFSSRRLRLRVYQGREVPTTSIHFHISKFKLSKSKTYTWDSYYTIRRPQFPSSALKVD
mgnify:CR=1 FL=1